MKYGIKTKWPFRREAEMPPAVEVTDVTEIEMGTSEEQENVPEAVVAAETEDTLVEQFEASVDADEPWEREAADVRQLYEGFDLATERQDPRFEAMLQAGVPMLDAYRAVHIEDILARRSEQIRADAEQRITLHVQARGVRPAENGTVGTQGVQLWQNVHQLTRQKRAEIAGRAHNGERITLR